MQDIADLFNALVSHIGGNGEHAAVSGAFDVVVVQQRDGTLKSSAFHVRIGHFQLVNKATQMIDLVVNGTKIEDRMYIDNNGAGYFIVNSEGQVPRPNDPKIDSDGIIIKRLRPGNRFLQTLPLRPGHNELVYRLKSPCQGESTIEASIFLLNYSQKLIFSDIDGTITRSDVQGHLYAVWGRDWTQPNIAELYSAIEQNGYQIIYLTMRPLSFYTYTKTYLDNIVQNNKRMPRGPIIMYPDIFFYSFKREVIHGADIYKSACMTGIQSLFQVENNPIFAVFGNRVTDAIAGRYAGVDMQRIYIVNEHGIVQQMGSTSKAYNFRVLMENCNFYFPRV